MFRNGFTGLVLSAFLVPAAAMSATSELPVSADRCAIFHALTGRVAPDCVPPDLAALGVARRLPPQGFDPAAASLDSAPSEQGYFIRFPFNSSELTEEYENHLARLGAVLASPQLANTCVKLVGHADSVGGPAFNIALSRKRAKMVAATLATASRVDMSRITYEARGESQLIAGIPGPHPLNRRVEILARHRTETTCD